MLFPFALAAIMGSAYADFPCICNFHDEQRGVYQQPGQINAKPSGYLQKYDCKPTVQPAGILARDWVAIAFGGKVGYVLQDNDVRDEMCAGDRSSQDLIMTTSSVQHPTSIMPVPTTQQMSSAILSLSTQTSRIITTTPYMDLHPTSSVISANTMTSSVIPVASRAMSSSSIMPDLTVLPSASILSSNSEMTSSVHPTSTNTTSSSIHPRTSSTISTSTPPPRIVRTESAGTTHRVISGNMDRCSPNLHTYTHNDKGLLTQYSDSCYELVPVRMTWAHAESNCIQKGGHLFHISNSDDELFIYEMLREHFHNHTVWMGLHDRIHEEHFEWSSEAAAPVNPYDHLTAASCLRTEAARKMGYGQDTGSVNPLQAKCDPGISDNLLYNLHPIWVLTPKFAFHFVNIGVSDRGDPVTYTHWKPGRKSNFYNHDSEDCVVFVPYIHHGDWDDIPCGSSLLGLDVGQRYPFICQFDAGIPVGTRLTTPQPSYIPGHTGLCSSSLHNYARRDGGTLGQFDRSCYELIPHHYNWRHAERLCEGRGGFLAHIQNADQQTFIQAFMMIYDTEYAVWIGLHDLNNEEHFEWTSGSDVTYTNWIPGRKSNYVSHHVEDCVALIPYKHGTWDDIPCGSTSIFGRDSGETHYVLCQYETLGVPSPVGK